MRGIRGARAARAGLRMAGAAGPTVREEESWGEAIRRAPLGVLVLAAALCFVAAGSVLGGAYLIFAATALGWAGWAMLLVAAPVSLYVALHLVRRSRWVWLATLIFLVLLLASSVLRALFTPGIPVAAFGEVAVELLFIVYLTRPRVRAAFGRA